MTQEIFATLFLLLAAVTFYCVRVKWNALPLVSDCTRKRGEMLFSVAHQSYESLPSPQQNSDFLHNEG
jgi:hypothetical protein